MDTNKNNGNEMPKSEVGVNDTIDGTGDGEGKEKGFFGMTVDMIRDLLINGAAKFNSFCTKFRKGGGRSFARGVINSYIDVGEEIVDNLIDITGIVSEDAARAPRLGNLIVKVYLAFNRLENQMKTNRALRLSTNMIDRASQFAESLQTKIDEIEISASEEIAEAQRLEASGAMTPGFAKFVAQHHKLRAEKKAEEDRIKAEEEAEKKKTLEEIETEFDTTIKSKIMEASGLSSVENSEQFGKFIAAVRGEYINKYSFRLRLRQFCGMKNCLDSDVIPTLKNKKNS